MVMKKETQFFTDSYWIEKWLKDMFIGNYTIDENLHVHVKGDVNLANKKIRLFPVQFAVVTGNFYASANGLESLLGSPHTVGKAAWFNENDLTSAQHGPQSVGAQLVINNNRLTSFEGFPQKVGDGLFAHHNQITSLEGITPNIGSTCSIYKNPITDFSYLDFEVKANIFFTPTKEMDYFARYVDKKGDVSIDFALFKKIQTLKNLEYKLDNNLPHHDDGRKKMKI
jgi:hypothetical protein